MQHKLQSTHKKRCSSNCQNHYFSLFCEQNNPFNCSVKFCPKYHREPKPPENTFPTFNKDKKYYTSAFILDVDRKTLMVNQHQQLGQHLRQIRQSSEKDIKILFPKPSKKNCWCMTCKVRYKSYFKHIMDQMHKNNTSQSKYNEEINALTKLFCHLHKGANTSPIVIIRLQNKINNQNNQEVYQQKQELLSFKEIQQLIISSDSQNQQKDNEMKNQDISKQQMSKLDQTNSNPSNSYHQQDQSSDNKATTTSNKKLENQYSQESSAEQGSEENQKQQKNSDSVQIIAIKPPKQPRNAKKQEIVNKQKKIKKQKKKKNSKSKKTKKQKSKKNKNENSKKKKKSSKGGKKRERDSSEESRQRRKNSIKRRPLDPPPSTPPLIHKRMAYRGASRNALPPENRTQVVLIEKIAIGGLVETQDKSFHKVLEGIVSTINKSPPAEAPRQYRKALDFIDSRVTPNARITQINPSTTNSQNPAKKSYQQKINSIFQVKQTLQPYSVTAKQPSITHSQISNQQNKKPNGKIINNDINWQSNNQIIQVLDQQQNRDNQSMLAIEKQTTKPSQLTDTIKQTKSKEIIDIQNLQEKKYQKPNAIPLILNPQMISLGTVKKLISQTQQQINRRAFTITNCPKGLYPFASHRHLINNTPLISNINEHRQITRQPQKNLQTFPNELNNNYQLSKNILPKGGAFQKNNTAYKQTSNVNIRNSNKSNETIKNTIHQKEKEVLIDLQSEIDNKSINEALNTAVTSDQQQIYNNQTEAADKENPITYINTTNEDMSNGNFNKK